MMTKKHFEAIAAIYKGKKPIRNPLYGGDWYDGAYITWLNCVQSSAKYFEEDNSAFNSARFFKACGL